MRGVALLASHWNTPIFGWVSQEEEFQDKTMYSTLVRFLGPLNRFRKYDNKHFNFPLTCVNQDHSPTIHYTYRINQDTFFLFC